MAEMKDVMVLRQAIENITQILAGRGIKVTQRGAQAYVESDSEGRPIRVNLPYIPEGASDELIAAIHGFLDHEVAHLLFTDFSVVVKASKMGKRVANMHNIVEDSWIEREMSKKYKGSASNLNNVGNFFLERFTTPTFEAALASGDMKQVENVLMVPLMRAYAGHAVFEDYMKDKWEHMSRVTDKLSQETVDKVATLSDSSDALDLTVNIIKELSEKSEDDCDGEGDDEGDSTGSGLSKGSSDGGSMKKKTSKSSEESESEPDSTKSKPKPDKEESEDDEDEESEPESEDDDEDEESESKPEPESEESEPEPEDDGGEDESEESEPEPEPEDEDEESESKGEDEDEESESKGEDEDEDEDESEGGSEDEGDPSAEFDGDDLDDMVNALSSMDFDETVAKELTDGATDDAMSEEYLAFTRDFDVIETFPVDERGYHDRYLTELEESTRHMTGVLQKHMERLFVAKARSRWQPGLRRGKINASGLYRLKTGDDRVFRKKQMGENKDVAISLVVDCSGSMSGSAFRLAMISAFAMSSVLDKLNVKHEVLGFTTKPTDAGSTSELRAEERRLGRAFSRYEPIYVPIFKHFNERLKTTQKQRMAYAPARAFLANNIDGESIEYAAQRLLKQRSTGKVMIVLSDGNPAGRGDMSAQRMHLKNMVKKITNTGIKMIGIGIETDCVKSYYPKYLVLNSAHELPLKVMGELRGLLI